MNKFYRRLRKYSKLSLQIFLFLLAGVALYFILPGEPKFKYEYQKGFPWKHENLVAPFDFTILKTAKELEDEKQEQISKVIPYFTCDTSVADSNVGKLKEDLRLSTAGVDLQKENVIDFLARELDKFYQAGILQFSVDSYVELNEKTEIRKRIGNTITRVNTNALYSEKSAYNELSKLKRELTSAGTKIDWLDIY